jgi:hypothetical protein
MKSMTASARKVKVSLTLSEDVLARVDREAEDTNAGRSGVVERWLRRVVAGDVQRSIDDATAAYYASLDRAAVEEGAAIARASSSVSRRLRYDEAPRRRPRPR